MQGKEIHSGMFDQDPDTLLKEFLTEKSHSELVETLLGYIHQDDAERRKWLQAAELAKKPPSLAEIKKMITKALPVKEVSEWRKVRRYFHQAELLFNTIFQITSNLPEDEQWKVLQHAISRLNKALERIEDTSGYHDALATTLCDKLITLFAQLSWSDEAKAQWLFEQLYKQNFDLFPSVPNDFQPSEAISERLREKCALQLEQIPANKPFKKDELFKYNWRLKRCGQPLIDHAIATGNWREHCSLLGQVAHDSQDLLAACQICLDNDEPFDAEDWLLKARKRCEDEKDQLACDRQEIEVLIALDEPAEAWKQAWALFESSPSFSAFKVLHTLEQRIGVQDNALADKAEQLLLQNCQQSKPSSFGFVSPVVLDEMLVFYLYQQQFDKALAWAKQHKSSPQHLIELANAIIQQQPEESAELYHQVIFALLKQSNDTVYQRAIDLLLDLEQQLKLKQPLEPEQQPEQEQQSEQDLDMGPLIQLLYTISQTYRHKHNLMALIREHFSQYL